MADMKEKKMKKLILLFTIACAGQLYGMEAESVRDLPEELRREIMQLAQVILPSNNLDEAITTIKKLSAFFGNPLDDLKTFTALVHILADKFNKEPSDVAKQFNTPTAEKYEKLSTALTNLIVNHYFDGVKKLIEQGADVNSVVYNATPLFRAAMKEDFNITELLLASGANVNYKVNYKTVLQSITETLNSRKPNTKSYNNLLKIKRLLERYSK